MLRANQWIEFCKRRRMVWAFEIKKEITDKVQCEKLEGQHLFFDECPTEANAKEYFDKLMAGKTSDESVAPTNESVAPTDETVAPSGSTEAPVNSTAAMGLTLAGVLFILQL